MQKEYNLLVEKRVHGIGVFDFEFAFLSYTKGISMSAIIKKSA